MSACKCGCTSFICLFNLSEAHGDAQALREVACPGVYEPQLAENLSKHVPTYFQTTGHVALRIKLKRFLPNTETLTLAKPGVAVA
jgi:hypothetical protein